MLSKKLNKQIDYLRGKNKYSELLNDNTRAADNAIIMLKQEAIKFAWLEEDITEEELESRYNEAKRREYQYNNGHKLRASVRKYRK